MFKRDALKYIENYDKTKLQVFDVEGTVVCSNNREYKISQKASCKFYHHSGKICVTCGSEEFHWTIQNKYMNIEAFDVTNGQFVELNTSQIVHGKITKKIPVEYQLEVARMGKCLIGGYYVKPTRKT